ncbi:hypothetical protein [Chelativorans salis]|uniref:Transmembrane anchored protein n=1 Tax=Chelativorans salis TaxID=2978478 RepID=A0ABT2LLH6_9HYPH|nr:hypothetical protein [Chelativorans sp. EGI FJ00035]MCT7375445.1 hypothetical protein [Chelativorans sp. EGI FJ00035]
MQARSSTFPGFADIAPRRATPLSHLLYALLALALLSLAIGIGGKWLGRTIVPAGHTDSRQEREIVVGNNVFLVPENVIRFERMRRDGVQSRLDLYLRWPDMEGYTLAAQDDFNHSSEKRSIVFISFEPRAFSRDMSGRLEPIYRHLLTPGARNGPAGLKLHGFKEEAGFVDEVLVVGEREPEAPFVARCLTGAMATQSLAPCERDINFGDGLSLVYRFPESLLGEWRNLDRAMLAKAEALLQTVD